MLSLFSLTHIPRTGVEDDDKPARRRFKCVLALVIQATLPQNPLFRVDNAHDHPGNRSTVREGTIAGNRIVAVIVTRHDGGAGRCNANGLGKTNRKENDSA
jgi:hypothetical protein